MTSTSRLDPSSGGLRRSATRRWPAALVALAVSGALAGCLGFGNDDNAAQSGGSTSSSGTASTGGGAAPPAPSPAPPPSNMPAAQPTTAFGPTEATIQEVAQKGPALALEEQFVKPMSGYGTFTFIDPDPRRGCPDGSPDTCYRDNYTVFPLQRAFFRNAVGAPDQLRQRAALALSQILVISGAELETMHGIGYYQQLLMNFAFANFRELLLEVTLSGRTLRVNDGGSDHAWGNHQLILGGAVQGGATYGAFPNQALGGPDDTDSDGRWIPTTAVDQYAATLAKWFGVPDADIPAVVPNIARFPMRDLGFMA